MAAQSALFSASVPVFQQMLTSMGGVLLEAKRYAEERDISPDVFLEARLASDMFALPRQVQLASDHAKGASARLAGQEPPRFADNESQFDDLFERIAKTRAFLASLDEESFRARERCAILAPGGVGVVSAERYLHGFALPNFFFHVTTAYNILRNRGVPLGKRVFIGRIKQTDA